MIERSNWSYDGGSMEETGRMRMASTVPLEAGSPVYKEQWQRGSDKGTAENNRMAAIRL